MALPAFLSPLAQNDPEFAEVIERVYLASMKAGALDQKTKLLITLALDVAQGATQGVTNVARRLRELGTTDQEIAEALRLAYFAFGSSILKTSLAAFEKPGIPTPSILGQDGV